MILSLNGTRAWALLLIARGATPDDSALGAVGFARPLSSQEAAEIAQAAIRGDVATVTARTPAGLTRENAEEICIRID